MSKKFICEALWECSSYEIVMFVHELHKRGYEQIRLYAGMSPSGLSWRWFIYPKVFMHNKSMFERGSDDPDFECVYGSTNVSFPHRREMVDFDSVINEIQPYINLAKGEDAEYVEWFNAIVEHAQNKDFPAAFSEYFEGRHWKFLMSGDKLPYPPYRPMSISDLSDEQMIDYARCTFDEFSVSELEEVLRFKGVRPYNRYISQVIRTAIKEEKGLINHTDLGIEKMLEDPYRDRESYEKTDHSVKVKMKSGEVIELVDEIDIVVWKDN